MSKERRCPLLVEFALGRLIFRGLIIGLISAGVGMTVHLEMPPPPRR